MKMKLGLITSGLVLSTSLLFCADSLESTFKNGIVSGSFETYGLTQDNKGGNKDSGFLSGSMGLSYETNSYKGVSGKVAFIGVHVFGEEHNGDTDEDIAGKSLMTEANVKYSTDLFSLKVGRQKLDLEWMTDFHQAIIAETTVFPDTSVLLGYSNKMALADADEISEKFEEINGNKGIYVLDIMNESINNFSLNPYVYSAPDLSELYGIKTSYSFTNIELGAHYAQSNENSSSEYKNGSVGHLSLATSIVGIDITSGYIKTAKNGAGSIISDLELGDNISPFEDGNYVYDIDAKTIYGSLGYLIDDVKFGILYGQTKYDSSYKENELNLSANIELVEDVLELGVLYVDVSADDNNDNYNKFILEVEYNF